MYVSRRAREVISVFGLCLFLSMCFQLSLFFGLFGDFHGEMGLLKGFDWIHYHRRSIFWSDVILTNGWSNWSWIIENQAPIGLLTLLYSVTGLQIPFLYTIVGCFIFSISIVFLKIICESVRAGLKLWPFMILCLLPSSFFIYGQVSKDSFSFFAFCCCALSLVMLFRNSSNKFGAQIYVVVLQVIAFLVCIWVRPYSYLILVTCWWIAVGVYVVIERYSFRGDLIRVCFLIFLIQVVFGSQLINQESGQFPKMLQDFDQTLIDTNGSKNQLGIEKIENIDNKEKPVEPGFEERVWFYQSYLEGIEWRWGRETFGKVSEGIKAPIYLMVGSRQGFITDYPNARSAVDYGFEPRDWFDVVGYLPRAITIGLLLPSPIDLLSEDVTSFSLARLIGTIEILIFYSSVCWLLFFARHDLKNRLMKIPLGLIAFGLAFILVYVYFVPNLGALYRFRFPGFILIWSMFFVSIVGDFFIRESSVKLERNE